VFHLTEEITDKEFEIYMINDLHIGLKGFREKDFIKHVRDPILTGKNKYWLGLGDYIEGRSPHHKFYDSAARDIDINDQLRRMSELLKPIADKCLGMVIGNHELSIVRETTINPVMNFCYDNKIPYAGNIGLLDLTNGRGQMKSIAFAHGAGAGSTKGAPVTKASIFTQYWDCDLLFLGHHHSLSSAAVSKHRRAEDNSPSRKIGYVTICGSFLSAYPSNGESYEETLLLPPNEIGYAKVCFDDELNPSITIQAIDL